MNRPLQRLLALLAVAAPACSDSTGPRYNPDIPTDLSATVTNPYFPLVPGSKFWYSGQTALGVETDTVEILVAPRIVNGVSTVEVLDRIFLDDVLIEQTLDWYAQDGDGNVWYLGEASEEIENGQVVSTEGSWEWGVNGALPGIIMWADPAAHIGVAYRQEYLKGVAEDFGNVVGVNQSVSVPFGDFTGCVKTDDWSGLDPAVVETKYYCAQVGNALEVTGTERIELVGVSGP